jgi:hypothetical protein
MAFLFAHLPRISPVLREVNIKIRYIINLSFERCSGGAQRA